MKLRLGTPPIFLGTIAMGERQRSGSIQYVGSSLSKVCHGRRGKAQGEGKRQASSGPDPHPRLVRFVFIDGIFDGPRPHLTSTDCTAAHA